MENEDDEREVKSTAVVKYSVSKPAHFLKLECNTDLNLPPSNWLSNAADSYGLQNVFYHWKGFSSFRMANMFSDCLGEVDVVSDAENIKNLLKIPYCNGTISMLVHRVDNTLLLDHFDIHKYLLRTSESEWKWLKEFLKTFNESAEVKSERSLYMKNRRRSTLKEKRLVSKFLYRSLGEGDAEDAKLEVQSLSLPTGGLPLPEPITVTPDPKSIDHNYNRNVIWTFEDIEMLIGTDLPIFGGGTHPCVSLRLCDISKPINVLTGIDYWLDNLMSNVPEVQMCYHINGIVQNYERIKTEDLPNMEPSKFSPKLIRDVAQSILSFLKSNATKAGHTYWLFKAKNEDVAKLYDLTSLCADADVGEAQNPFTVPVAMLLYRVARNMKHASDRHQPGTIRMLLKNCVKLLSAEKYPEVVTSSHYMLSDLYVPAGTNPESPGLDQIEVDDNEVYEDDDDDDDDDPDENAKESATKVLFLDEIDGSAKFKNHYKRPPAVFGTVEERCSQALQHVDHGLSCLQYFPAMKEEEREVPVANPNEPIPMPYAKINENGEPKKKKNKEKKKKRDPKSDKSNGALLLKNNVEAQALPTWQNFNNVEISWKDHLKTLLYEKAVLVYATLSEQYFGSNAYGKSLRTIGLLARCQLIMGKLVYNYGGLKENCLLGRAGDCCIMMVQNWDKVDVYKEEFRTKSEEDCKMTKHLERDEQLYRINIGSYNVKCVLLHDIRTIEQMLLKGVECYEEALTSFQNDSILRRLGNGLNEVGSFYLNKAKLAKTRDSVEEMCAKAKSYLVRGLQVFEKVKDDANTALLYTNTGHLHRLLAHANTPKTRGQLTAKERLHYHKAFDNYKRALQVLGERKHCPGIWDAVTWELSTAYLNMGTIMHDNPPSNCNKAEAEKEVIEALQKALTYCDPNVSLYQYRVAVIHFKIGCIYHSHILNGGGGEATNRKLVVQLAKNNYEKAAKYYLLSTDVMGYFTAQLQRSALSELFADNANVSGVKIKHYRYCLDIFVEMNDMISLLASKDVEIPEEEEENGEDDQKPKGSFRTFSSLLNLVRQRLQHILKMLVKLCLSQPPPSKDCPTLAEIYRSCYALSLTLADGVECGELVHKLCTVLKQIAEKVKSCASLE